MLPPPPTSTLFPYTTLFRSNRSDNDIVLLEAHTPPLISFPNNPDAEKVFVGLFSENEKPNLIGKAENIFLDRKSTRLNSSHSQISYAVFCLKKKKKKKKNIN